MKLKLIELDEAGVVLVDYESRHEEDEFLFATPLKLIAAEIVYAYNHFYGKEN